MNSKDDSYDDEFDGDDTDGYDDLSEDGHLGAVVGGG